LSDDQLPLFENPPAWTEYWQGMPEFEQKDLMPWQSIKVHFRNEQDRKAFAELVGQRISRETQCIWHPKAEIGRIADKRWKSESAVNPRYPVYVISKGRWESRLTSKALEKIGVPYRIVVEPQERAAYASVIDPAKILTLPFSNLGQGSIPARNWVWDHSIGEGAERHWILDDNMDGFYRMTGNLKVQCSTGSTFLAVEDFADRYENVGLCGFNYFMFAKRKDAIPPIVMNTRIYSCILIQNDVPLRWRGRYNEDTDLSIRVLKSGLCTVLFNAFLTMKTTTMTMKGGNTDDLYQGDGRRLMAESLRDQHPDCVTITRKWNRWQHQVDYSRFKKNKLILKPGVVIPEGVENYGMKLEVRT
jgi:hypothetical protein